MSPDELAEEAYALRHELAGRLELSGHIRTPQWRTAVEVVPRHEFVREFFERVDVPNSPTLWDPTSPERSTPERWLKLAYKDASHVTQLDGKIAPADVAGPVEGNPTSSSTMPSLVARMWEDLEVRDGDRVLEIGTGTGYSTALGCERLGADNITSVEVDPKVAERARQSLTRAGYQPHLIVGDGEDGAPSPAPYDRIIATCSFREVPPAWLARSRPGTIILVTLSGWLGGTGLAKLTVTGAGTAEGTFLPGYVSFMPARAQAPQPVTIPDLAVVTAERPTAVGPDVTTTYGPAQMIAQLAIPDAQYLQLLPSDGMPEHLLVQPDDSYATFAGGPGSWTVREGGPVRLWDQVEAALAIWRAAGEPELTELRITVTAEAQSVHLADDSGRWSLPPAPEHR